MYNKFFGLQDKPFSLLPDPRYLFPSATHRIALSLLEYGLGEQTGFVVVTGEVGTGKTTLVRQLLRLTRDDLTVGLVNNTHESFGELLKWILSSFEIEYAGLDRVAQHQALVDFLIDRYAAGNRSVLIIDEAQNLSETALEEIRMLSNVNTEQDHLLQLILVGQPELLAKLRRNELRQFVQRIAVDYHLEPLNRKETRQYVRHRLSVAGGDPDLIDDNACAAIHHYARGIPRLINLIADLALVYGYAEGLRTINIDTVLDAIETRVHGGLWPLAVDPESEARDHVRKIILATT